MVQCSGFHKLSSNSIESWLQSGNNANKNVLKSITPEASPFTKQSYSDSNQVEIFKLENEAQSSIDKAKMISPCFLNSVGTSDVSKKVSRPLLEKSNPFNRIKRKKSTESVSNQSKISFFMNVAEPNTNSQSKVLLSPDQMLKKMPNETIEDSGRLSSSELIELQKCKECKEMFPRVGMQEHMDWHFAMKLQKHG
ncbi:hypothetical protein HMI55_000753 [Coelomomyces lativittatus]|nr:hypothetical protein HMI55_000753 [Coelomomyces lativittatus]